MAITVSGSQEQALQRGDIQPIWLVDIHPTLTDTGAHHFYFSSGSAINYCGNLYQPYIAQVAGFGTSASFPENAIGVKEFGLVLENAPYEYNGERLDYLSETFDDINWELSAANVKLLLLSSGIQTFTDDVAMPVVTSGSVGAPNNVTRESFSLAIAPKIIELDDAIPMRVATVGDFPELDRDERTGNVYIPIVVGSGVRIRAIATGAGATTTVAEYADSGYDLKVSDTTGFIAGDTVLIGSYLDIPFGISSIDSTTNVMTLDGPLTWLPLPVQPGMVVREDRGSYSYTVNNAASTAIREVYVKPRGQKEFLVLSGTGQGGDTDQWSMSLVADSAAIGGYRTDLVINEIVPMGSSVDVTQQPVVSVPGGNHDHGVAVTGQTTQISYPEDSSPGGSEAIFDGNEDTYYTISVAGTDEVFAEAFPALDGTFASARYYMTAEAIVVSGDVRIRKSATAYLTISSPFGKGEFRSTTDSSGDEDDSISVIVQTGSTACDVYEVWKEVTLDPVIAEDSIDLSDTSRDTDVEVSGADLEVGEVVEVLMDGVPVPDATGRYGNTDAEGYAITNPAGVVRWLMHYALGQTDGIIDVPTITGSQWHYDQNDMTLRFALQKPIKLRELLTQIGDNSKSTVFWGREGLNLKYLDNEELYQHTFTEDTYGVTDINWSNSFSAADIRNSLTAFYDLDWTRSSTTNEAYNSSIVVSDTDSSAIYGTRTNEISNGVKAYHLDMVTDLSHATVVMNALLETKAYPTKQFTINTDWTWLNLEPGDTILVDTPTLPNEVVARIVSTEVDPRLMTKITAQQINQPGDLVPQETSVRIDTPNLDGFSYPTNTAMGIANRWTCFYRWRKTSSVTSNFTFLDIRTDASNASRIYLQFKRSGSNHYLAVSLFDTSAGATPKKEYNFGNMFDGNDRWYQFFVTWDGTNLRVYLTDNDTGVVSAQTPTYVQNSALIMADDPRRIATVTLAQSCLLHEVALWNTDLSQAAMQQLVYGTPNEFGLDRNLYPYNKAANLKHWYRFGQDGFALAGKDFAGSYDLDNGSGLAEDNIVNTIPLD